MMRALLAIPPAPYLIDDRVFPCLGILQVAAVLEDAGHAVKVLDLTGKLSPSVDRWAVAEDAIRTIADGWDFLGLTCTTPDFPQCLRIREHAKEADPALPVVIGGPHASVATHLCGAFDYVCTGDGETAVLRLLGRLRTVYGSGSGRNGPPGPFPEVVHKGDLGSRWLPGVETPAKDLPPEVAGKVVDGPLVADLDALPLPARHLIDLVSYRYQIDGRSATNVMTQRGCSYGCAFCCGRDLFLYRQVRVRSPENVLAELDKLHARYGFRAFMLYDDEVNLIRGRTLKLMAAFAERDYLFRGFIKANLFDEPVAKAMADAGFVEVCTGVESGSDAVLKRIGKGATVADNTRARRLAREHGMRFKAFTIVGLPGETLEDVMATRRWLIENRPDSFDVTLNTPYPGAPEYDHREKYDLEFSVDYEMDVAFYKGIPGAYNSFVRTSALSFDDLRALRDRLELDVRRELGMETVDDEQKRLTSVEHSMAQGGTGWAL